MPIAILQVCRLACVIACLSVATRHVVGNRAATRDEAFVRKARYR